MFYAAAIGSMLSAFLPEVKAKDEFYRRSMGKKVDKNGHNDYNVWEDSSALRSAWDAKRIENRVRVPDGTAAVCVVTLFMTKVSHWKPGKAEQVLEKIQMHKSEDLLELFSPV